MSRAAAELIDRGDVDALRALLDERPALATSGYQNDQPPSDDFHLLMHVVSWPSGRPNAAPAAQLLLEHGADPDTRYNGTETALHWAASGPDNAGVVEALAGAGADVDAGGGVIRGGTPLMNAVHFGFVEVADQLVGLGASVHNMITAAGLGRVDLLETWFEDDSTYRADAVRVLPGPKAPDRPLDDAEVESWTFGAVRAALMCSQFHVVDWFIERGFDIDHIPDDEEWGCLHHAGYCGSLPMAMFLVERGADIDLRTKDYAAPAVGFACVHGHPDVMNYLVDLGADITMTDAAYFGRLDKIVADGGRYEEPARLLATMIGTTTVVGKPVAESVAAGRLAIARFLLQRDPGIVHELVDGTSLIALAEDAGDAAMSAVFHRAAELT